MGFLHQFRRDVPFEFCDQLVAFPNSLYTGPPEKYEFVRPGLTHGGCDREGNGRLTVGIFSSDDRTDGLKLNILVVDTVFSTFYKDEAFAGEYHLNSDSMGNNILQRQNNRLITGKREAVYNTTFF
jgi:hypothetical protein